MEKDVDRAFCQCGFPRNRPEDTVCRNCGLPLKPTSDAPSAHSKTGMGGRRRSGHPVKHGIQGNWRLSGGLSLVCIIVLGLAVMFIALFLPKHLKPQQRWKWTDITSTVSDRSVAIESDGFDGRNARFLLHSNHPERFPCWFKFHIEPTRIDGFSVPAVSTWFRAVKHRLKLPESTDGVYLHEELFLQVDFAPEVSPLPVTLLLAEAPTIDGTSVFGMFREEKKSLIGTITISLGVPQNINPKNLHARTNLWRPIYKFDYVMELVPGVQFR